MAGVSFHNSRTRRRENFVPRDPDHVRMYVCGPTVYDRAHIGNARSFVVFDVVARLLRACFPALTYVRNITDIDDKISARAAERGIPIGALTAATEADFAADMAALGVLPPDIEPRATAHVGQMVQMIERLIGLGHAYVAEGHVLFAVASDGGYGQLSGRTIEEMRAGARVEVAPYKRDAADFVLWKPSLPAQPGFESPWGRGRPGWHIECSAMATQYLGTDFDLHGGGQDLLFPHHENECAQSLCAHPGSGYARVWLHSGMLRIEGEKMSKSLGNVLMVPDLLARAPADAVRLLFVQTHYRAELDFTEAGLGEARRVLDRFQRARGDARGAAVPEPFLAALREDVNTPGAIAVLHRLADAALAGSKEAARGLDAGARMLGLMAEPAERWFHAGLDAAAIEAEIGRRLEARQARNFAQADAIRAELLARGIVLEDTAAGTSWRRA